MLDNPVIEDGPFVNATGLVAQLALAAAVLVTPVTSISQVAVPALMLPAVTLIVDGAVSVTVAAQPDPKTIAVAPVDKRNPDGSVSTKEIPDCTGLPLEFVSRNLSGATPPRGIEAAPNVFVNVGGGMVAGGVTTRHWLVTPLLAFANPLIDDWPFVNAAGLVEQSTLAAAVLVIPLTAISQLAVPTLIAPAETLMVEGAVNVTVAEQPVPVTVAVAPVVKRKPDGKVSTKAMPLCTGLPVAFVNRKLRDVLAPERIAAAPKVLVNVGGSVAGGGVTTKHWLVTPLLAFVSPLIEDGPLVNAAGLVVQSTLAAAVLVIPFTAISQLAVPALMVPAVTLMVEGAVNVTFAEQPVPVTIAVAPVVKRKPEGRVSTKAMPLCAGLPVALASRKFRGVLAPAGIVVAPKALVKVGVGVGGGGVTTRHWLVTPLLAFVSPLIEVGPLVNAGGFLAQSALETELLVTPLTEMSQIALPALIVASDTAIVDEAVNITVPVQPTPTKVAVAPVVRRKPEGSVSTNEIPACAGLPVAFVSRKFTGVLAPARIEGAPKDLVSVGGSVAGGGVTTKHWLVTPLLAFVSPLIEDGPLVNAAGLVVQSTLAAAVLVIPFTAISQLAVPALMVPAVTLMVEGAVNVTFAEQPVPVTIAVAPVVKRKPEGRVSTKAMPLCAGLPVALASRKFRGVLAPAGIVVAPKALVKVGVGVGGGGVTTRHWLVTPLLAFVSPLIEVGPFVNAAGLVVQSTFAAAVLVIAFTAISQLAVPVFMVPAETVMVEGAVNVTVAEQPVPVTDAVAPVVKRKPEGKVSTKAIPVCTGLPTEFLRRKLSGVAPPLGIAAEAKLLVSVAKVTEPTATLTGFVVLVCVTTPICWELVPMLVMIEPGGATAAPASDIEASANQKMTRLISEKPVRLDAFCSDDS